MNNQALSSEELIRRYVFAVSGRLPKGLRTDVARELESLLRDSVEERGEGNLAATAPETTAEILLEMGPPDVVAARYSSKPDHLIGPTLYPAFIRTLRLVLMASGGLALLAVLLETFAGSITGLVGGGLRFLQVLIQCIYSFCSVAVLVFALLERLGIEKIPELDASRWNPFDLPAVDEGARISTFGVSLKIYAIVLLLIWFNFFPQWFGVILGIGEKGVRFFGSAQLGIALPALLINVWWIAALVKNILLMRRGSYSRPIVWFEVALGFSAALIFGLILEDLWAAVETPAFRDAVGNPALAGLLARLLPTVNVGIILTVLGQALLKAYRQVQPGGNRHVQKPVTRR